MEDCVDEGVLLADLVQVPISRLRLPLRVSLLSMCHDCYCLPLPLSDRVPVVAVATAVVFWLHLEGRTC